MVKEEEVGRWQTIKKQGGKRRKCMKTSEDKKEQVRDDSERRNREMVNTEEAGK